MKDLSKLVVSNLKTYKCIASDQNFLTYPPPVSGINDMNEEQFKELTNRLDRLEELLLNIQPKPKKPRQTKIVDSRSLETQMRPFQNKYAPSLLRDFWLYWSQKTKSGKEKWQMEKVFDVPKRLETWRLKEEKWQWEKEQREALKKVNEKPIHRKYDKRVDD